MSLGGHSGDFDFASRLVLSPSSENIPNIDCYQGKQVVVLINFSKYQQLKKEGTITFPLSDWAYGIWVSA